MARRPPPVMPGPRSASPRTAVEIVSALRADIVSGRIPREARLPSEAVLAEHYLVSKATIREALRALESLGLVEVRHGSGTYARGDTGSLVSAAIQITSQLAGVGIVEALDVRAALGLQSVQWAARTRTASELDNLRRIVEELDALPHDDFEMLVHAIGRFQEAIAGAAHNALIAAIEGSLIRVVLQMQSKSAGTRAFPPERWQLFQTQRRAILHALERGDGMAARAAMAAYLGHQRAVFIEDPVLGTLTFSDPVALRIISEMAATAAPVRAQHKSPGDYFS